MHSNQYNNISTQTPGPLLSIIQTLFLNQKKKIEYKNLNAKQSYNQING